MRTATGQKAQESPIAVYGALAANAGIAVSKFVAAAVTGSSAMLSEAIHSTVDTGNELLLLLGLRRAREKATREHPYGHGKELYFWGFVVAIVIFAGGGGMAFYEGIAHLRHPHATTKIAWNLAVLGIALLFEGASFAVAVRSLRRSQPGMSLWQAMRRSKDPSVYTVVVEDFAAIAGVLVAFAGVVAARLLEAPWIDGAASLVIGAILGSAAVVLAIESRGLLVGESGGAALVESIRRIAASDPAVRSAERPLTMQLGPDEVLVNLAVQIEPELDAREVARAIGRIEAAIRAEHPTVGRIFVAPRTAT
jgi:cation diffusion facilitator family transporter